MKEITGDVVEKWLWEVSRYSGNLICLGKTSFGNLWVQRNVTFWALEELGNSFDEGLVDTHRQLKSQLTEISLRQGVDVETTLSTAMA